MKDANERLVSRARQRGLRQSKVSEVFFFFLFFSPCSQRSTFPEEEQQIPCDFCFLFLLLFIA